MSAASSLSAAEAVQYDRQLRLWGVAAQTRLQASRALIVNACGLGSEVAKNLALAGLSIDLCDAAPASIVSTEASFLLAGMTASHDGQSRAAAVAPRLQALNALVSVRGRTGGCGPRELPDAELRSYALVVHCGPSGSSDLSDAGAAGVAEALALAARCRSAGVPVAMATSAGWWGAFALDYGPVRAYALDRTILPDHAGGEVVTVTDTYELKHVPLCALADAKANRMWPRNDKRAGPFAARAFAAWAAWAAVAGGIDGDGSGAALGPGAALLAACEARAERSGGGADAGLLAALATAAGDELAAVVAVLAGQLGTEAIKLISGKGEPVDQLFIFDALGGTGGSVYRLLRDGEGAVASAQMPVAATAPQGAAVATAAHPEEAAVELD